MWSSVVNRFPFTVVIIILIQLINIPHLVFGYLERDPGWNSCWMVADNACGSCDVLQRCWVCVIPSSRYHEYRCHYSTDLVFWYVILPIILGVSLIIISCCAWNTYKNNVRQRAAQDSKIQSYASILLPLECKGCGQTTWKKNNSPDDLCDSCKTKLIQTRQLERKVTFQTQPQTFYNNTYSQPQTDNVTQTTTVVR